MRSRRHPGPLAHVLVAGDVSELAALQALLCLLPERAYGQVYVETEPGVDVPDLPRPARVGITTVVRHAADAPGVRLSAAVAAWAEEWMVGEHDPAREVSVWVGGSVRWDAAPVQGQLERL